MSSLIYLTQQIAPVMNTCRNILWQFDTFLGSGHKQRNGVFCATRAEMLYEESRDDSQESKMLMFDDRLRETSNILAYLFSYLKLIYFYFMGLHEKAEKNMNDLF
jgi:hypothetical protein